MQQPPFYQTSSPPPKRQSFPLTVPLWFFLIALALVIVIAFIAGRIIPGSTTNTSASTTTQVSSSSSGTTSNTTGSGNTETAPAQVTITSSTKWKTVKSYSNTGDLKTEQFTITGTWQLVSTCDPSSEDYDFYVGINVYHPDGHFFIPYAINYTCSTGDHNEQYVVYQGDGTFYLQIIGAGTWTLNIQEIDQ